MPAHLLFDQSKRHRKLVLTSLRQFNGTFFSYRVHPISLAECIRTDVTEQEIHSPQFIDDAVFDTLLTFGGFLEPFLKKSLTFTRRWKQLRKEQLFREDIRDISRIQKIGQLEVLAELLKHQAGQLDNYSNLANKVRVSIDIIRRWVHTLSSFYFCFVIRP